MMESLPPSASLVRATFAFLVGGGAWALRRHWLAEREIFELGIAIGRERARRELLAEEHREVRP